MNTDFISVDDCAYKKGSTYRTIIADGHTHQSIELLNGRDGKELKDWLKENKQIKTVTRDRALAYARAIQEILPEAMQVADRFHLHQNFLECIQKVIQQNVPDKIEDEIINAEKQMNQSDIKKRKNRE